MDKGKQGKNTQKFGGAPHCALCLQPHWTDSCTIYESIGERIDRAIELKLCLRCLQNTHGTYDCRATKRCFYCQRSHHCALCNEKSTTAARKQEAKAEQLQNSSTNATEQKNNKPVCALCQRLHWTNSCSTYRTVGARMDRAKEIKLCLRCLLTTHRTMECRTTKCCRCCEGPHNSAFCIEAPIDVAGLPYQKAACNRSDTEESTVQLGCKVTFTVEKKAQLGASTAKYSMSRQLPKIQVSETSKSERGKCATGIETSTAVTAKESMKQPVPEKAPRCALCEQTHWTHKCTVYRTAEDRHQKAMEMKLCFRCFRDGHQSSECSAKKCCFYCRGLHNSALCHRAPIKYGKNNERVSDYEGSKERGTMVHHNSHSTVRPRIPETASIYPEEIGHRRADEEKPTRVLTLRLRRTHTPASSDDTGNGTPLRDAAETEASDFPGTQPFNAFRPVEEQNKDELRRSTLAAAGKATTKSPVQVKWQYNETFYRIEFALEGGYAALMDKVRSKVPDFEGGLAWKDEENDMVALTSDEDLALAISMPTNQPVVRLFTIDDRKQDGNAPANDDVIHDLQDRVNRSSAACSSTALEVDDDSLVLRALTSRIEELETDRLVMLQTLEEKVEELESDRNPKVQNLKQKVADLESQVICKICSVRRVEIAYQCGHTLCSVCDGRICASSIEKYWEPVLCCFCRKEVTSRVQIYS